MTTKGRKGNNLHSRIYIYTYNQIYNYVAIMHLIMDVDSVRLYE